ncbi:hypothetical protein HR12_31230 [Microbacterium sp. SUBG005]|nr:hypothetical protein HR12_31230 [Microbacterium sp. SUBG005]
MCVSVIFAIGFLADDKVVMTTTGDLRQVSHTHDLCRFTQLTQQFADNGRGRAADPHIHFIENQRRGFHFTGGDNLDRQSNTGELTARCHFGNRL